MNINLNLRYMYTMINKNKFGLGIFNDLKKALDSLQRHFTIKIEVYGLTDTDGYRLKSYLERKKERIPFNWPTEMQVN